MFRPAELKMTTHNPKRRIKREITAGFIVYRRTHEGPKFLLLYHRGGYWNFPKGKIEAEERSLEAALRETREEAGLSRHDLKIMPGFKAYERFYFRQENQPIFKIVIFYLAETHRADVRISSEHNGYGWFLHRDAKKVVSRYKDTERALERAFQFLQNRRPPALGKREG